MKDVIKTWKEAGHDEISACCLPIQSDGKLCGRLRPLTVNSIENADEIEMLANWRRSAQKWFTTQFHVTAEGTKSWLDQYVLQADDRVLFIVESVDQTPIGQIGLCHINDENKHCELDNILRGNTQQFSGWMNHACRTLLNWSFRVMDMETVYLRVLSDNQRAVRLYQNLGFREIQRIPLVRVINGDVIRWVPPDDPYCEVKRYLVIMRLSRNESHVE